MGLEADEIHKRKIFEIHNYNIQKQVKGHLNK